MTQLKTIATLATKNKMIPVLATVAVKDGIAYSTDMDVQVGHPVEGVSNGLFNPHGFADPALRKRSDFEMADFPFFELKEHAGSMTFKIDALKFVAQTQSKDEARYYLNGVCFHGNTLAATDGHRMNVASLDGTAPARAENSWIIPTAAVDVVLQIARQSKAAKAKIDFYADRAEILVGQTQIITRYVDGRFPDVMSLMPKEFDFESRLMASEIKALLPTLKTLAKQSGLKPSDVMKLEFLPKDSLMGGVATYAGQDFSVCTRVAEQAAFNPVYLSQSCDGPVKFSRGHEGFIAHVVDPANKYQSVIMGMKV